MFLKLAGWGQGANTYILNSACITVIEQGNIYEQCVGSFVRPIHIIYKEATGTIMEFCIECADAAKTAEDAYEACDDLMNELALVLNGGYTCLQTLINVEQIVKGEDNG